MIDVFILTNWKKNNYNSIFDIINGLIKIVYYKLIKITINILRLIKVIINMIVLNFIVTNRNLSFALKFWLLLSHFLE